MVQSSKLKACLPWQAPHDSPFSIASCVTTFTRFVADRPRMENSLGWQAVQLPAAFDPSTCMSWLKVTTPGLSPLCGSFSAPGSFGMLSARAAPPMRSAAIARMSFVEVMVPSVSGQEELPREVVPLVPRERARDAVHRRAAVLQDLAELRRELHGDPALRLLHEPARGAVLEELPEVRGEPRRLHLEEPPAAVRVVEPVLALLDGLVHRDDGAVDGR